MRRPTVLLADDHGIVTDGLGRILKEADFDVVGAVSDGQRLVDAAILLRPDVIITDLSMPRLSGLDVLARLKSERIESKVIVLTMHHDADLAADAIRGGASGFLLKESAGDELVAAVRHALEGKVYITPAVTKDVMGRLGRRENPRTAAHAAAARHPAADRQRPADEGDRCQPWSLDTHRRRPQIRDDGDAWGDVHRRTREICARPPAACRLITRAPPQVLSPRSFSGHSRT